MEFLEAGALVGGGVLLPLVAEYHISTALSTRFDDYRKAMLTTSAIMGAVGVAVALASSMYSTEDERLEWFLTGIIGGAFALAIRDLINVLTLNH